MRKRSKGVVTGTVTSRGPVTMGAVLLAVGLLCLLSCAPPSLYTINLRYSPVTADLSRIEKTGKPFVITVAHFVDKRDVADKLVVGTVVNPDGTKVPVLPKYTKPVDALLKGIQAHLEDRGYEASGETPDWDLTEAGINSEWEDILIGGTIDALDVVCLKGTPVKKYRTEVKLTVYFADVKRQHIFYKVAVETKPTLEHIRFSEEMLEKQINGGLTDAIEKIFEGRDIYRKIQEALAGE